MLTHYALKISTVTLTDTKGIAYSLHRGILTRATSECRHVNCSGLHACLNNTHSFMLTQINYKTKKRANKYIFKKYINNYEHKTESIAIFRDSQSLLTQITIS